MFIGHLLMRAMGVTLLMLILLSVMEITDTRSLWIQARVPKVVRLDMRLLDLTMIFDEPMEAIYFHQHSSARSSRPLIGRYNISSRYPALATLEMKTKLVALRLRGYNISKPDAF